MLAYLKMYLQSANPRSQTSAKAEQSVQNINHPATLRWYLNFLTLKAHVQDLDLNMQ